MKTNESLNGKFTFKKKWRIPNTKVTHKKSVEDGDYLLLYMPANHSLEYWNVTCQFVSVQPVVRPVRPTTLRYKIPCVFPACCSRSCTTIWGVAGRDALLDAALRKQYQQVRFCGVGGKLEGVRLVWWTCTWSNNPHSVCTRCSHMGTDTCTHDANANQYTDARRAAGISQDF